jgi:hypothetical protein
MQSITQSSAFSVVLSLAILAYIIYRQLRPRRLHVRGLVIAPLLILYFILSSVGSFHPTSSETTEIVATSVISLVLGLLACRSLRVYASPTNGKAMASGSWTYFLWWVASFVIKAGLAIAFEGSSFKNLNEVEILIPVFLLVSTRSAYLYWKTTQLGLQLHSRHDS